MIKRVDVAVFDAIRERRDGSFARRRARAGLADDGVGFVYDDNNRALHPADVVRGVRALTARIIAGRPE